MSEYSFPVLCGVCGSLLEVRSEVREVNMKFEITSMHAQSWQCECAATGCGIVQLCLDHAGEPKYGEYGTVLARWECHKSRKNKVFR